MDRPASYVIGDLALTAAELGTAVVVTGFGSGIQPSQLEQLFSYGLVEGRVIAVLRQRPVTVVLIDHTELALEPAIAAAIRVRAQTDSARG
jgi:Fe2+ transport system protein FeoA